MGDLFVERFPAKKRSSFCLGFHPFDSICRLCGVSDSLHLKYGMSVKHDIKRGKKGLTIKNAFEPKTHLNSHGVCLAVIGQHIVFKRHHWVMSVIDRGVGSLVCHKPLLV